MSPKPNPLAALPFLADPKRAAEDERLQEIRRASFTRSKLAEDERLVSRGMALEEIARRDLAIMEGKREEGNNRRAEGGATLDMVDHTNARLSEGLALQGKFREAAACHPLKTKAAEYEAIADAIERDDDAECNCQPKKVRLMLKGRETEVEDSPRYVLKTIFSPKHGKAVAVERCAACGFVNARPARGELAARLAAVEEHARRERRVREEAAARRK